MAERRIGWMAMLAVLVCALAAARASAQDRPELARVEFGWNWTVPAGRWVPVRVWLEGGSSPSQGIVSVSFNADRTQRAEVITPASTTPGKITPVDLVVNLPADCGTVKVSYQSSLRRRPYELEFRPPPTAGTFVRKPDELGPMFGGTRGLIVHAGVGSIARAFPQPEATDRSPAVGGLIIESYMSASGDELAELRWRQLAATDVAGAALPTVERAYDGLEALVLNASKSAAIPAREREAITRWVESGGRLVLVVDDDSSAWRSWLPLGPGGDVVQIAPPAKLPPPQSVIDTLSRKVYSISVKNGRNATQIQESPWNSNQSQTDYELADPPAVSHRAAITGSVMQVTPAGAAAGWTVAWRSGPGGLVASGPVGMGLVTLVGTDPELIPDGLNAGASSRLWRDALRPALNNYLETPFSGGDPGELERSAAFNTVVSIPQLNDSVFNAILFSLFGLALLMGPIDWFVLKRFQARQHSWLVALGWITIASLIAFIVPPRLRSGPPQINRMTNVDVVQASNDLAAPARAWQEGLVGIFAAGPLRVSLDRDAVAGAWWRGAAPADPMAGYRAFSGRERRGLQIFGPLVTAQLSNAARDRENIPEPFAQPSWSYRTLAESSSPPAPPIRAVVERRDGKVVARVSGLPGDDLIASVKLMGKQGTEVGELPARFERVDGAEVAPRGTLPTQADQPNSYDPFSGSWSSQRQRTPDHIWTLHLRESERRKDAIDARLASGEWCEVRLVLLEAVPSSRFIAEADLRRDGFESTELTTLRLLVPLDGESTTTRTNSEQSDSGKEPKRD